MSPNPSPVEGLSIQTASLVGLVLEFVHRTDFDDDISDFHIIQHPIPTAALVHIFVYKYLGPAKLLILFKAKQWAVTNFV